MLIRSVVKLMEWTLMSILALMVILVFGNVVLRYGFNSGIVFSEEVSRFLFIWLVFLGAVLMLKENGHLGVHTLTKRLPLAGQKFCKLISDLLTLLCCVLLTKGGWALVLMNMKNYALVSEIPLGIIFISCLICSVGMGILLLNSIWRLLTGQITAQELCPDFDDVL